MENKLIKKSIESEYNIEVKSIEKFKSTYRINGNEGYCLKIIKYDYPHCLFIIKAMNHLVENGLRSVLPLLKTKSDKKYIRLGNKNAYLTKWINGEESNFDVLNQLDRIGEAVGELHVKSRNFSIPQFSKPRIGWMSWIKVFETRKNEIYDFKNRIHQKAYKNDFDKLYLENFDSEIKRCDRAIEALKKSNYLNVMEKQVMKMGFCHHDLANHNIILDKENNINFIDFDYCILDSNLHDLASLIWRVNKFFTPSVEKTDKILKGYTKKVSVDKEEVEIMKAFLSFPQEFWQIGLQVYWEQQPWGEEFMINKLENYLKIIEGKVNMIESIKI